MYQILTALDKNKTLPIISAFDLALVKGEDAVPEAAEMQKLLVWAIAEKPEERENILLDVLQSSFTVFMEGKTDPFAFEDRFNTIYRTLFKDMELLSSDTLWTLLRAFYDFRSDFKQHLDSMDLISQTADALSADAPVTSYLIRREVLNLLLSSTAFLKKLEMTKDITRKINSTPAEVKMGTDQIRGEVFFYAIPAPGGNK